MPPKPQPGKKGKEEQEDFSDVPTLPPLNSYIFTLLYTNFPQADLREKVQKFVQEKMPQDRVKILTRDDIVAYGKAKNIILEPAAQAALPVDDPKSKMTDDEQLAKAAIDKLFEMAVYARRAKKEKILKLEEEAKAQPDKQVEPQDPDYLDVMVQLVDYPNTQKEALSFAKYGSTIQCVFQINFLNQNPNPDDETVDEAFRNIYPLDYVEAEVTYSDKNKAKIQALRDARSSSIKSSHLRKLAIIEQQYYPYARYTFKINEQGEQLSERKEPETLFQPELYKEIERHGALFIKYRRFKEKVTQVPLMPDKGALREIQAIDQITKEYQQWLSEVDSKFNQESLSQTQRDLLDPASQQEYNQQREQKRLEIEQNKKQQSEQDLERRKKLDDLKQKLKLSVDDQKNRQIKTDVYKKDFIKKNEVKNSIASVMSAMITQLSDQRQTLQSIDSFESLHEHEATTQEQTLDDLFQSFANEVQTDLNLSSNEYQEHQNVYSNQFLAPATASSKRYTRKGTEALAKTKTQIGELEYQEELDLARKTMLKLPKEVTAQEEDKAEEIYLREKNIIKNLVIPGGNRHLMPPVPTKSQRLRDSENPGIYPFCTLPVDDAERGHILKAFQELIKGNLIDEGQPMDSKHPKYKVFERMYESHMNPDILRQVLAEAFLQEPDTATQYYQRKDYLLVALYNKVNLERDPYSTESDGIREWRAAYRVMPDFENWLKYFADQIIIQVAPTNLNNQGTKSTTSLLPSASAKFQLDEEMIPDQMLDIDDQRVQNIEETSELFYPEHNAVMRVDNFAVGGENFKKAVVYKDNLSFGLREAKHEVIPDSEKEYGLASYKRCGDTEFWLSCENEVKILVESIEIKANEQRLIRIDPPKPTPEQIAAKEEAIKAAQLAASKNKGKNASALGNIPPVEEKEPEPTWEPEPMNFLDSYFNNEREYTTAGPLVTTTLPNGLIVQHLFNGQVCQTNEENFIESQGEERDRIFTESGVVIRHLKNKDAEVLFSNGYKANFNRKDMSWIITNNKGMRRALKDGAQWDIDAIPCAIETDAVTNAKMLIREDNVMTIQYIDGSTYCQHADGTQFRTNSQQNQIRIEKEGFAPIVVKVNIPQQNINYDQLSQFITGEQRAQGGYCIETYIPDGTLVETYLDVKDVNGQLKKKHVFKRNDFSVFVIDEDGDMLLFSSNARSALNEIGGKNALGRDYDYVREFLYQDSISPTSGVFYCKISSRKEESNIYTADHKFLYQLTYDLNLHKVPLGNQDEEVNYQNDRSMVEKSEYNDGREIENVGGYKNPKTKHYLYPRLFVIRPDSSGYELLSKEQLEYYFRVQKSRVEALKQRKMVMVGSTSAKSYYFLTNVKTLEEKQKELQIIQDYAYPDNAKYALLRLNKDKAKQTEHQQQIVIPDQYLFRQIFEFQDFEDFKQEAFYDDLLRYKEWKFSQARYDNEFGIVHVAAKDQVLDVKKIEDDEYFAKRINLKILRERSNKRPQFQPEEFKKAFIVTMENSEEMSEYHARLSHYDRGDSIKTSIPGGLESQYEKQQSHAITIENVGQDQWIMRKKISAQNKVKQKLAEIQTMLKTPQFIPNFFKSKSGMLFTRNNPGKPPSQEILVRMSQRINRSQQNTEKNPSQFDGYSQKSAGQQSPGGNLQNEGGDQQDNEEDKDNPIVALEPEDQVKQNSPFLGSKSQQKNNQTQGPKPSLYVQERVYLQQKEQEQLLKAEEYHVVKTKDFNVVGRLRQEKPFVESIQKSNAIAELNEKFITTECIADRRVKISSMAARQYINAPTVEQVRKQGQHQMILSAINKKQTFAELINQANSMVTSVLHDPLKRSLNILPESCSFGTVQAGIHYEMTITVQNEDSLSQRITIKPTQDKRIVVTQEIHGLIAPGWTRNIIITLKTQPDEQGNIKEDIQIVTKLDIYKIPVEATILPQDKFKEYEEENRKLGKRVVNSRIRQRLNSSIQDGKRIMSEQQDSVDNLGGGHFQQEYEGNKNWIQTTGSESKLPKIPPMGARQFIIDPKKNVKDVMKR